MIPLSSLPGLDPTEAFPDRDARKVIFALVDQIARAYKALPEADRLESMGISRELPIAMSATTVRQRYTLYFDLEISGADVADE
jgi:hypothetical protein